MAIGCVSMDIFCGYGKCDIHIVWKLQSLYIMSCSLFEHLKKCHIFMDFKVSIYFIVLLYLYIHLSLSLSLTLFPYLCKCKMSTFGNFTLVRSSNRKAYRAHYLWASHNIYLNCTHHMHTCFCKKLKGLYRKKTGKCCWIFMNYELQLVKNISFDTLMFQNCS